MSLYNYVSNCANHNSQIGRPCGWAALHNYLEVYLKSNNMVKNPLNWNFKPRLLFIRKYIAEIPIY